MPETYDATVEHEPMGEPVKTGPRPSQPMKGHDQSSTGMSWCPICGQQVPSMDEHVRTPHNPQAPAER